MLFRSLISLYCCSCSEVLLILVLVFMFQCHDFTFTQFFCFLSVRQIVQMTGEIKKCTIMTISTDHRGLKVFGTSPIMFVAFTSRGTFFFLIYLFIYLFIYDCVESSLWCTGFSLWWLLLLWSMGSRQVGFSSCGM